MITAQMVDDLVTKLETSKISFELFKQHSRYPYTFAYDVVRMNFEVFGFEQMPSRGECVEHFGDDKEELVRKLADIYYQFYI